jgi:succinate dehydrogenase (ubiquinone) cytochrome b560 subunit
MLSLRGNLTGTVEGLAGTHALLLFPFKFAVLYTITYHYLGGLRHFVWDHHRIGDQVTNGCPSVV